MRGCLLTLLRVRVDNTTAQRRVRACARLDPAKKKLGEEKEGKKRKGRRRSKQSTFE